MAPVYFKKMKMLLDEKEVAKLIKNTSTVESRKLNLLLEYLNDQIDKLVTKLEELGLKKEEAKELVFENLERLLNNAVVEEFYSYAIFEVLKILGYKKIDVSYTKRRPYVCPFCGFRTVSIYSSSFSGEVTYYRACTKCKLLLVYNTRDAWLAGY